MCRARFVAWSPHAWPLTGPLEGGNNSNFYVKVNLGHFLCGLCGIITSLPTTRFEDSVFFHYILEDQFDTWLQFQKNLWEEQLVHNICISKIGKYVKKITTTDSQKDLTYINITNKNPSELRVPSYDHKCQKMVKGTQNWSSQHQTKPCHTHLTSLVLSQMACGVAGGELDMWADINGWKIARACQLHRKLSHHS